jgi:polysaccharide biosynthesis transport protein
MEADLHLQIPGNRIRPFDFGNFLLRRGPWIAGLGILLFLIGLPAAFVLRNPFYRTSGRLLLTQKVKMFLDRQEELIHGDFRDFAATYSQRLVGSAVTHDALSSLPRERWPDFIRGIPDEELAARVLSKKLAVIPMGRSYLLEVVLIAGSPEGMADTVNAVMESFLSLLEKEQGQDCDRRLAYLDLELVQLKKDLAKKEADRASIADQLGHASFSEERNPFYELLIAVQLDHQRAKTTALEQKSLLQKAERDEKSLGEKSLEVFADEAVASNQAVFLIDNWTYQKLQDLRAGIDGLTDTNTERVYVEQRMQAMNDYLEKFKRDLHKGSLTILEKKRAQELAEVVTKAQNTLQAGVDFEQELKRQLDETKERFAKSSLLVSHGKDLSAEMEAIKDRISRVLDRIREVHLEAKLPVHVGIDELAIVPQAPEGDNLGKLVAMIFVGAFGFVAVTFTVFEVFDGRIRSPGDIKAALGALPADPIPCFGGSEEATQYEVCVRDYPLHSCSVAVNGLALRLERERIRSGAKVVLLTGGEGGSGVTWLARNLGESLTQYVERVLIIRLDAIEEGTKPGLNPGYPFDRYFEEAWKRISAIDEQVTHLVIGPETPLMRRRDWLCEFLSRLTPFYGVILLDARPIADSDLTRYIAGLSQVAIMVAGQGRTRYRQFRAGVELLVRLGTPAITGVLVGKTEQPLDHLITAGRRLMEEGIPRIAHTCMALVHKRFARMQTFVVPKIAIYWSRGKRS